jgi:hypothetical protein
MSAKDAKDARKGAAKDATSDEGAANDPAHGG